MADSYKEYFKLGIVGFPLEKTLSPLIHEIFLREAGLAGEYLSLPVTSDKLESMITNLSKERYCGVNVTYPHKRIAAGYCDILISAAEHIGTVNTIVPKTSRLEGWNTDIAGFTRAVTSAKAPAPFYIVGSGGAARAVVHALEIMGQEFRLYCRTPADWCRDFALPLSDLNKIVLKSGTVVNATTLGWNDDDSFPLHPALLDGKLFFDLNYNPDWIWRNSLSSPVNTGEEMLVFQAAESFRIWTGINPGIETALLAVEEAMNNQREGD